MGDEKRIWTIYCHTCTVTGKKYVGQTVKKMEQRWLAHASAAWRNGPCRSFHAAIRKHGADAFIHEVLGYASSQAEANALEVAWISRLNCRVPVGYNMALGGDQLTASLSPEELRAKSIKAAASQTPEQRREKALKGVATQTPEQLSAKSKKRWDNATPEQRARHAALASLRAGPKAVAAAYKQWETKRARMSPERLAEIEARKQRDLPRPGKSSESRKAWWVSRTPEQLAAYSTVMSKAQKKYRFRKMVAELAAHPVSADLGYGC